MPRILRLRPILMAVLLPVAMGAMSPAFAQDEGDLLRQIKSDLFDRKWDAVLGNCDKFIGQYQDSESLSRAYYYRAQALEHIRGRENDAIEAYGAFIDRFPQVAATMKEDALLSRLTLTTSQWLKGDKSHVRLIMDGMDMKGYPRVYAAIQASKIGHRPAQTKALPILKQCAETETDVEMKNECAVAVLRIDPQALPADVDTSSDAPTRTTTSGSEVKLIRLEVFDKAQNKVVVRVNMPIAFAELILESLQQVLKDEISHALQEKGIGTGGNLDAFWKAIKDGGPQTILEIDNGDETIKLWVE